MTERYRTRRAQITNRETGEIIDAEWSEEVTRRRRPIDEQSDAPFVLMFPREMAKYAPSKKWELLFVILDEWPIGQDTFKFSTSDLQMKMGIKTPQKVSHLLKELEDGGFIERLPKRTMKVNPLLFWRGKPADRRKLLWDIERMNTMAPEAE